MKKNTRYSGIKKIVTVAILLLPFHLLAGYVDVEQRIYSTPVDTVKVGQPSATATTDLTPTTGSFADARVTDLITFGVDHHYTKYFASAMDVKIKLHIQPYDAAGSPLTAFYQYLTINYHPDDSLKFIDKNAYRFTGIYKYDFTIDSIYINNVSDSILPANLYVDGLIRAERYYDFTSQASTPININALTVTDLDCDGKNDEIDISWPVATGAEEYQLEWTFVNDYDTIPSAFIASSALPFNFRNNATRITTVNCNYRIPLLFDHGYVLFRVRALGRDTTDPSKIIVGVWSDVDNDFVNVAADSYHITVPHESSLNWQVTTTFAEEGKKKEVISYFDGSLRSRQVVTRINSDSNVVVGETIYDHQGRPAVNVLPAPVAMPSCSTSVVPAIRFYPNFNQDDSTHTYSLNDFDIDGNGGACTVDTSGMNVVSGASNYYSPANGNLNAQQAFVPDAKRFPFSRVEYTPDNTGRIRRQSGVGPEFQLGNGHETKYYYGQPNQIQLDRLFGSEAGYAAHYKKNIVIDPNGQPSVSYLDQEGRVVATALAGDAAPNTTAIASASSAAVPFSIDLFAKDANGNSLLNTVDINQTSTEFSSQLLVPYAGNYFFSYDMSVDALFDSCFSTGVCFGCVYDMKIRVTDECGNNLASVADTTVGHFSMSGDTLVFSTTCSEPSTTTLNDTFTIYLPAGSYTMSKILTVNKQAQDFYVKAYLDSANNSCFKTLHDFQQEYLALVDTSDCYINCSTCAAALGDRDSYVASGKGSAFDYDVQMEKCGKMCKEMSPCELSYEMMLKDVSPGGQYAEYYNTTTNLTDPSVFPLSVLNDNNVLPYSFHNSGTGRWHNPLVDVNGTNYPYYLNEDGTRSTVTVTYLGILGFSPSVVNVHFVELDTITNTYYTYPENLSYVTDFIPQWKPSWAKSLVQFHPEYCYYETCREYGKKQITADSLTSDGFDNLLRSTNTFSDAVSAGFIKSSYLSFPDPNDRVEDWFTLSSSHPYDPFVTNTGTFGSYGTTLQTEFNSYLISDTNYYSMLESAANAVRCGNIYGILPGATCLEFGKDYIVGGPSNINDSIRDMEWNMLKSFYLSAKAKLQNTRGDYIALHTCQALNDCIGEDDFNPVSSGMITPWPNYSPYHDMGQPCGIYTHALYVKKQKRFPDPEDYPTPSAQDVSYQLYMQTGQCPSAHALQELLGVIAAGNNLETDSIRLIDYAQYNALYLAKNNFAPQYPITTEDYIWKGDTTSTGDTLNVYWTDPNNSNDTVCTLILDKSTDSIPNWDDILGFKDLLASGYDGTNFSFTAIAVLPPDSGSLSPFTYQTISGYTSCINILNCSFPLNCKPNAFASDIQSLMTALAMNNDILDSVVYLDTAAAYHFLVTNHIRQELGTPNTQLEWYFNTTDSSFVIRDTTAGSNKIVFKIRELIPDTAILDSIAYFVNMTGAYEHFFEVDGFNSDDSLIAHIKGQTWLVTSTDTSEISMGTCSHPSAMACNEKEHHVREDLQHLLDEKLSERPFTGDIDLFQSLNMTPLLQSYLAIDDTVTSSVYIDTVVSGTHYDTLTFTIDGCNLVLWHNDDNSPALPLDSLIGLTDLTGRGVTDAEGNYHDFIAITHYMISGSEYTDTISGTSCWPLKNCFPCPDTNTFSGESLMSMSSMSFGSPAPSMSSDECEVLYWDFLDVVNQYDTSDYFAWSGVYLDSTLYYNFLAFVRAGKCDCAQAYIDYLTPYLASPADTTLPLPVDIDHYTGCIVNSLVVDDPCKDAYYHYLVAVGVYDEFAFENRALGYDSLGVEYSWTEFTADSLCYCVDAFVALVNAIVDSRYSDNPDSAFTLLHFKDYCSLVLAAPCAPNTIPLDTFISPTVPYENPCVAYKINMALQNAQLAYNQYVDSLTTIISDRYREHCLGAAENYTAKYTDKEYHFTLYYYDQAGNLVKTVPPEGVEPLPIDSSGDSLEVVIQNNRLNNTHTVFTQHRMATHYEYNSLNQLVRQSMPDQDNMDIWETTLPNGLDSRLKISQTQFVTATRGYLSGFVDLGSGVLRGYVYITDDGGVTWKRFGGEVGADMNKIQWTSTTIAYAVGDYGTVIKSTDGGNSWIMLNVWGTSSWTGTDIASNLNDLYFTSSTKGLMVGDNCLLLMTANGGTTFTAIDMVSSNGLQAGDNITSVTYDTDNSKYYITVNHPADNTSFISMSSDDGYTWTTQTSVRTTAELRKVQYYGTDSAYAAGADGTLLHTSDDGVTWNVVATHTADKFTDVYFRNANEGIALIENSSAQGELWKTFDAGNTWAMLGLPGDNYKAFYPYEKNSGGAKVVAVGASGRVSRVIMQANTGYGVIDIGPSSSEDAKAAWTITVGSNLWIYVAGDNGSFAYTTDATASVVTWTSLSTGISSPDNDFVHFDALPMSTGTNPAVSGALLSSTGKLFSVYKAQNSTSYAFAAFSTPTPSSNNFADLAHDLADSALLAVNNTDEKLYYITLHAVSATTTATTVSSNTVGYSTVTSMNRNGVDLMLVTSDGELVRGQVTLPSTATYTDRTTNLVNIPLQTIEYSGSTGKIYAAGADGNVVQQNSTGNWFILPTGTAEQINALNFNTTTTGLMAENNGKLFDITVGSTSITSTPISTYVSENLNDISRTSDIVYVAGDNGTLLYSADITLGSISPTTVSTNGNLKGVAVKTSSSSAMAVGDHAHMRWCYGATSMQNKQVFTVALRNVHFTDANNGYAVGDKFTVRKTTDGGNTWNVVLPLSSSTTLGSNMPDLGGVYTLPNDEGVISGTKRYVGQVSGITATPRSISTVSTSSVFSSIDFASPTEGFIVGKDGTTGRFLSTTDGGVTWITASATISNTNLRCVKAFKRNGTVSFITGGANSVLQYWNGSSFSSTACTLPGGFPSTVTFTDIFFHDDLAGYVVGTKGIVLRSEAFAFSSTTGLYTTGNWIRKNTDDSLLGQTDSTKMGESTIAFATRHNGFIGGAYDNTSQPTAPLNLARLIRDESDEFSTYFWYDRLGRIVVSQNSRQYAETPRRYSYSTYDALGRVNEAGEKYENSYGDPQMNSIFGTYVNTFYNPKVIDDTKLTTWITETSGIRTEVTHTYYDTTVASIADNLPANFSQDNLRKRVVCTTYSDTIDAYDSTYNYATHYSYDIHGNVKSLLQDNKTLATYAPGGAIATQEFKKLNYSYDLISENVKNVDYESDSLDAMHHAYAYDADNRITEVQTSTDDVIWDKEAKYFYYAHGPLARTELGNDEVQGMDYAYTLQGWIKGVNSNTLDSTRDMGRDADTLASNPNRLFGKDVYGYTLNYFDGDYTPIDAANKWTTVTKRFEADKTGSDLLAARNDDFNGNISAMVTTITDTDGVALPQGMAYTYDQLNRLLDAKAYININIASNSWNSGGGYANRYYNSFAYDANGNILGQLRYDQSGNAIDSLKYRYKRDANGKMLQNRLYHVNDTVSTGAYGDDIDNQGTFDDNIATMNVDNNYSYDQEGRLVKDSAEEIQKIIWTVTGKVRQIIRYSGSSKKNLKFDYDAMGMRIAKHIFDSSNNWEKSTYYVRDPQGNVMATYDEIVDPHSMTLSYKLKERDIYGSSRLGMKTDTLEMLAATVDTLNFFHSVGNKFYELTNHLGNVLSVVTDKIISKDWNNDTIVDSYVADIVSATDYYPFGVEMKERMYYNTTYKYGLNGQEHDEEIGTGIYTAEFWEYDSRLGRRWNVDPKPNEAISPYACFSNNPIYLVDINGDTTYRFDNAGKFLDMGDLEVSGIQGSIGAYKTITADDGSTSQAWQGDKYFNFNDAGNDKSQLDAMKPGDQGITILSDANIYALLDNSDIYSDEAQGCYDSWFFAKNQSNGGKMDYSATYFQAGAGVPIGQPGDGKGGFIIFGDNVGGVAYNLMDAGNFMWGLSMHELDFDYLTAQDGSEWFANWKDSEADQRAIRSGWAYKLTKSTQVMNELYQKMDHAERFLKDKYQTN